MLKVKSIITEQIYTVYNVQEYRGTTYFLIYKKSTWYWATANDFEPYEECPTPTYVPIPYYPYTPPTIPTDDWWKQPYITWTCDTKTE